MMAEWIFFILGTMIRYHGLLMNRMRLNNDGYFFRNVECLLLCHGEECVDFVHIWYSYQVPCVAHVYNIAYGSN